MSSIGKKRRFSSRSSLKSPVRAQVPLNTPLTSFDIDSDKTLRCLGMFDSGIGGLTVMKQLIKRVPSETIIYLGDTARLPYGEKSRETIIRYSIENSIFLMDKYIKLLIVACNTASAYAIDKLRKIFNIPIVSVIEPGAQKAVQLSRNQRIAILGTKGTIQSGSYQKEIHKLSPHAKLFPIACPLFVPLVEESFIYHPATKLIVQEYLAPLKGKHIDTLLLGCTHYPLLHDLIQQEMGPSVNIIDSATCCAERVAEILEQTQMSSPQISHPQHTFYVSDDPEKFRKQGEIFLGFPISHVEATTPMNFGF